MISIPMVRRKLASDLLGHHIYLFGHEASCTTTLRRLADAGAQEGTVVLSEGKGSRFGAAALFRPALSVGAIPMFSAIATLALAEAIAGEELCPTPVWPNQVVVEDKTVGWSVVEIARSGDRMAYVILGVDVDLRALESIARRSIDPNVVVAAFLNALDKWSTAYAARGPAAVSAAIQFLPRGSGVRAPEEQSAR